MGCHLVSLSKPNWSSTQGLGHEAFFYSVERHTAVPSGLSFILINNNEKSLVSEMQGNLFV